MKKILKADYLIFQRELLDYFSEFPSANDPHSPNRVTIPTIYGSYNVHVDEWDGPTAIYSVYGKFQNVDQLPRTQVPYHFARPDTHQTYSLGGDIFGHGFNGYSGKWNFHFGSDWEPMTCVRRVIAAIESIRQHEEEVA